MTKEELEKVVEALKDAADKAAVSKIISDNKLKSDIKDEDDIEIIKAIVAKELEELGKNLKDGNDGKNDDSVSYRGKTTEQIVDILKSQGAKTFHRVVTNATVKEFDTWTRVSLTLDKPIKGFVAVEDKLTGEVVYKKGITNIMFTSLYALNSILKQKDKNYRGLSNYILGKHDEITDVVINAEIDIVSQFIEEGVPYINPFANKPIIDGEEDDEDDGEPFDHDVYINNVYNIAVDKTGKLSMALIKMKQKGLTPSLKDMMDFMDED